VIQDKVQYELKKSDKARHLRITIKRNGAVIVTVPKRVSLERGKLFAEDKMDWIKKTVARVQSQPKTYVVPRGNRSDYLRRKEEARRLVEKKLQSFNAFYGLAWNGIAIRNTASRWGSCSSCISRKSFRTISSSMNSVTLRNSTTRRAFGNL
jgi:predicted metal-dependent hydrolase